MGKSRVRSRGEASRSRARFRDTAEWKDFRLQVIAKANNCCEICGMHYASSKLQVHHRNLAPESYEDISNIEHFMALDSTCHRMMHSLHGKVFRKKKAYTGCSELRNLVLMAFV